MKPLDFRLCELFLGYLKTGLNLRVILGPSFTKPFLENI
jgi:hypothetical protein